MNPDRDHVHVAAGLFLLVLGLLAVLVMAGCVPTRPHCELGTFLSRVDTDTATSGGGSASGTAVSGSGRASWKGSGSSDWWCARLCPGAQLLKASQKDREVLVECSMPPAAPPAR